MLGTARAPEKCATITALFKTSLTDEIVEKIGVAIETPAHTSAAVGSLGVSRASFYSWMRKGRVAPYSIYGKLRERVLLAESRRELHLCSIVHQAAHDDAKWAAWLLKCLYPERYSENALSQPDYDESDAFSIDPCADLEGLTPDDLETLARAAEILERIGGRDAEGGPTGARPDGADPVHEVHIPRIPNELAPRSDS